jgi:hypothetical protein
VTRPEQRRTRVEKTTVENRIDRSESGDELVSNIRRLTTILLEKLEEDSKAKTIDQTQMRLVGAITLRALRLWEKILRPEGKLTTKTIDQLQQLGEEAQTVLEENTPGTSKNGE